MPGSWCEGFSTWGPCGKDAVVLPRFPLKDINRLIRRAAAWRASRYLQFCCRVPPVPSHLYPSPGPQHPKHALVSECYSAQPHQLNLPISRALLVSPRPGTDNRGQRMRVRLYCEQDGREWGSGPAQQL